MLLLDLFLFVLQLLLLPFSFLCFSLLLIFLFHLLSLLQKVLMLNITVVTQPSKSFNPLKIIRVSIGVRILLPIDGSSFFLLPYPLRLIHLVNQLDLFAYLVINIAIGNRRRELGLFIAVPKNVFPILLNILILQGLIIEINDLRRFFLAFLWFLLKSNLSRNRENIFFMYRVIKYLDRIMSIRGLAFLNQINSFFSVTITYSIEIQF